MAKKVQKKPAKKTQTKGAAKAKKAKAPAKKAAAPKKKVAPKKAAAPKKKAAPKKAAAPKKVAAPKKKAAPKPAKGTKAFSVAEFAGMTYLTENGVMQWLQQGLLTGQQNAKGEWQIEASNLKVPNVKRLVR